MFGSVLIANRGEVAVRIAQACKELDIESVAVYSDADTESRHVEIADSSVHIGPSRITESYLDADRIVAAAEESGVDALHPGYGLLSENGAFARRITEHPDITWIGPDPAVVEVMGDKTRARERMYKFGVPVVPGTDEMTWLPDAIEHAEELGYPVAVKAAAGGGGKGLNVAQNRDALKGAYDASVEEGRKYFGDDTVYLEKYVDAPRHVEVQILGDGEHIVHLGERECSVQRRHQKLIEETPSPFLDDDTRVEIQNMAVEAGEALGYSSAGTIEFLVSGELDYYFLEMNTRLQVEHPITELVTGVDIVKEQISVAATGRLRRDQDEITFRGHAIECRINAEDHRRGFAPTGGEIADYLEPNGPGIRIDSGVQAGTRPPIFYDSLLAKLVAWDSSREEAISRAIRGLDEFRIDGLATTIPFHQRFLRSDQFGSGGVDTNYVESQFLAEPPG